MSNISHKRILAVLACALVLCTGALGYNLKKNTNEPMLASVSSSADFKKTYDNYEELIKDTDIIVYGIVEKAEAFFGEDDMIYTKIQFKTQETIKGETTDDTLTVIANGGIMPLDNYLENRKEYMTQKLTPEVYEQMLLDAKLNNEMFNYKFNGVENITENSNLLFFLRESRLNSNEYYITGTPYFGKFKHDSERNLFYREKPTAPKTGTLRSETVQNELVITLDSLKEKIESTENNFTEYEMEVNTEMKDIVSPLSRHEFKKHND